MINRTMIIATGLIVVLASISPSIYLLHRDGRLASDAGSTLDILQPAKEIGSMNSPANPFVGHKVEQIKTGSGTNQQRPLKNSSDWGLVPPELVQSGAVSAAQAEVLNQATIRFGGSASQASEIQTR